MAGLASSDMLLFFSLKTIPLVVRKKGKKKQLQTLWLVCLLEDLI